jgi:hypothetical protein
MIYINTKQIENNKLIHIKKCLLGKSNFLYDRKKHNFKTFTVIDDKGNKLQLASDPFLADINSFKIMFKAEFIEGNSKNFKKDDIFYLDAEKIKKIFSYAEFAPRSYEPKFVIDPIKLSQFKGYSLEYPTIKLLENYVLQIGKNEYDTDTFSFFLFIKEKETSYNDFLQLLQNEEEESNKIFFGVRFITESGYYLTPKVSKFNYLEDINKENLINKFPEEIRKNSVFEQEFTKYIDLLYNIECFEADYKNYDSASRMYNSLCSLITAKSLFLKKLEGEKK